MNAIIKFNIFDVFCPLDNLMREMSIRIKSYG